MDEVLPGLGELPEVGAQDSLFALAGAPRLVQGEVPHPVASVHVEMAQPHMDRVFDYLVPAKLADKANVGARVIVPVGSQQVSGFIVERGNSTNTGGKLRPLVRVVSPLPVLTPEIYSLAQRVALRGAGSVSDILRLAIPGRHARAEKEYLAADGGFEPPRAMKSHENPIEEGRSFAAWLPYQGGAAFLMRLTSGESPRAVCHQVPSVADEAAPLLAAVAAARESGRGVLIVVPTSRRASDMAEQLREHFGTQVEMLVGEEAPSTRYRSFLRIRGGQARIVVGTRAAMWAPVHALGLIVVADDAADTLREVRSPYCEAREVLALRASLEKSAMLIYSPYVSVQSAALVQSGWAALVEAQAASTKAAVARVSSPEQWVHEGTEWHRIPDAAFDMVRESLQRGPVLIVVPRAGYIPAIACAGCHRPAVCSECGGHLQISSTGGNPRCSRCGSAPQWRCPYCHGGRVRAIRIGSHRTAEEIGRAFPGVGVVLSGAQAPDGIAGTVRNTPRIVVATPGAEPHAEEGFAGALVLDSRYLRGEGMEADIEFMRHATRVIARVRPASSGGHVMFAGGIDPRALHALTTWDLAGYARELLQERAGLELPPTMRWLAVTGERADLRRYLALLRTDVRESTLDTPGATGPSEDILFVSGVHTFAAYISLLGPVEARDGELTLYLRTDLAHATELSSFARAAYRAYSSQALGKPLRLETDPRM